MEATNYIKFSENEQKKFLENLGYTITDVTARQGYTLDNRQAEKTVTMTIAYGPHVADEIAVLVKHNPDTSVFAGKDLYSVFMFEFKQFMIKLMGID